MPKVNQREIDKKLVDNAKMLKQTMETDGWRQIVSPLLDKMIVDIVGFKRDSGEWMSGSYGDKRLGEIKADRLLWYRQALIEFNKHLFSYFRTGKGAQERLKKVRKTKSKTPMLDSKYNHKETSGYSDSYSGGIL